MFTMKSFYHGFLVDSQNSAIRHRGCGAHAKRLARKAAFAEKVSIL